MSEEYIGRQLFAAGYEFGRARLFSRAVGRLVKLGLDDKSHTTARKLLAELQRTLEDVVLRLGGLDVELSRPAAEYDISQLTAWFEEQGKTLEHDVARAYGAQARRLFRLGAVAHETATYRQSLQESKRSGRQGDVELYERLLRTVLEGAGLAPELLDNDPVGDPDKLYDIFTSSSGSADGGE